MAVTRHTKTEPGFYDDDQGVMRWWDGGTWTPEVDAAYAVPIQIRNERLQDQIESFKLAGYRLESVAGAQAVVSRVRRLYLRRNVPAVILTAGLWLIPLIYRMQHRSWQRIVITVDDSGAVRYA